MLLVCLFTACAAGEEDGIEFSGPTSAATMYGSSGGAGSGDAETSEAGSSTTDTAGTSTDTTDASTDTGDASTDTADASTDTTDTSTDTTDASTDTTDASTDTTDSSTDTTDASTDTTDASGGDGDTTGGDGDGDGDTTGGAMCGNGMLELGEDCDDGNASSNDGCSSACTWESNCGSDNPQPTLVCGGQGNGNMVGAYSDVDAPVCGQTFAWQDRVYVFTPDTSGSVTATFTSSPDPGDGAIAVMEGSCHSQLCIATSLDEGNYHSVTFDAIAGLSYYIDLELPSQQPNFTLSLTCG